MVHEDERGHRLNHRHGARQHARVVTATAFERGVVKGCVHRVLLVHDRGDGLERRAKENRLTVRDAALDAAGTVRGRENFSVLGSKRIVVFAPRQQNAAETGADFKRLRRGQT